MFFSRIDSYVIPKEGPGTARDEGGPPPPPPPPTLAWRGRTSLTASDVNKPSFSPGFSLLLRVRVRVRLRRLLL